MKKLPGSSLYTPIFHFQFKALERGNSVRCVTRYKLIGVVTLIHPTSAFQSLLLNETCLRSSSVSIFLWSSDNPTSFSLNISDNPSSMTLSM